MKNILFVLCLGLVGFGYGQCVEGDCENGKGKMEFRKGSYIGEWKDGMQNGQGTYTWVKGRYKGDKYVGEYKDDK
ncbi:hypothetical protein N9O41_01060, partial [Crocinitomicaceae bacterium]|nr:hypothetical protein [Crocinitomicaceae bacterium]